MDNNESHVIRRKQLEIMDYVHAFCERNNISYFLTGGSLIGAIRHNGYIPWDDDIDIMMFRDDYELFISLFNRENIRYHAYSLNDSGYNYHFCKISDEETQLEETNLRVHDVKLGINIDLFPLDKFPSNVDEKKLLNTLHNLNKKMYGKSFKFGRLKNKPLKQCALICIYKLWGCFTSLRDLGKRQEAIAKSFADADTDTYTLITSHIKKNFPKISRKNTYPIDHSFEGRIYKIPSTYDEYLTQQYGDYMVPPKKVDRNSGHSFSLKRG